MARQKGLSFYRRRKKINSAIIREVFSRIFGVLAAIFIALVLNVFFGMSTTMVGASMEPNLYNGQRVYVDRFRYAIISPRPGDVIVFMPKGNEKAHYYIKRVIAGPGDRVLIRDGAAYVNGLESTWVGDYIKEPGIAENDLTLGAGEYFCIGDNPAHSEDSRSANIGLVNKEDIVGRVWFRRKCPELSPGFVKYKWKR